MKRFTIVLIPLLLLIIALAVASISLEENISWGWFAAIFLALVLTPIFIWTKHAYGWKLTLPATILGNGGGTSRKKFWDTLAGIVVVIAMAGFGFWAVTNGWTALRRINAPSDELIMQRIKMAEKRSGAIAKSDAPVFRNFSSDWQAYTAGTAYRYRRGRGASGAIHILTEDPSVIVRFEKVANPAIYSVCTFDHNRNAQFSACTDDGLAFEEWQFTVSHDVRMRVWYEVKSE